MKRLSSNFSSEKGMTLIEILASIVVLSIIIVSFLSMFVQSSKTNSLSKDIDNATYLAETQIEEINNMNNSLTKPSLFNLSTLILGKKDNSTNSNIYNTDPDRSCTNCFDMNDKSGRFVLIQLKSVSSDLGKVIVIVYKDDKKLNQEAQMEMLLTWKK